MKKIFLLLFVLIITPVAALDPHQLKHVDAVISDANDEFSAGLITAQERDRRLKQIIIKISFS